MASGTGEEPSPSSKEARFSALAGALIDGGHDEEEEDEDEDEDEGGGAGKGQTASCATACERNLG